MIAITLGVALVSYLSATAFAVVAIARNRPDVGWMTVSMTAVGAVLHTVSLGLVCVEHGGWPVEAAAANLSFIAWGLVVLAGLVAWRYRAGVLLAICLPMTALLSTASLMQGGDERALAPLFTLSPDVWLSAHVALMLLAVAGLAVAGLAGVLYLLQEGQLKSRRPGVLLERLPSLQVCDLVGYRALTLSFALLTAGLLAGVVEAWLPGGPGWSWDVTTGSAVAIWVIVMALLYGRWAVGWRGRKAASLAVAGTLSVTGLLLGVLLLAGRFHPLG